MLERTSGCCSPYFAITPAMRSFGMCGHSARATFSWLRGGGALSQPGRMSSHVATSSSVPGWPGVTEQSVGGEGGQRGVEALSPTGNQVLVDRAADAEAARRDRRSEVIGLQHVDGSSDARRVPPRAMVGQRLGRGMREPGRERPPSGALVPGPAPDAGGRSRPCSRCRLSGRRGNRHPERDAPCR